MSTNESTNFYLTVLAYKGYENGKITVSGQNLKSIDEVCPPGNYKCSSGECIDDIKKCDGDPHCQDGTDESSLTCGQIYSMDVGDALKSATKTFVVNCEGRCEDIRATIKVDRGDPDIFASEHQPPQIGWKEL